MSQAIAPGVWNGRTSESRLIDMRGVEFSNWRVSKVLPVRTNAADWEIQCVNCGATRKVRGSDIRRALRGGDGPSRLGPCTHEMMLNTYMVKDLFGIKPSELLVLIAVMAYERTHQEQASVSRLELVKLLDAEVDTSVLVRKGYLEEVSRNPLRVRVTKKAWRATGFTREASVATTTEPSAHKVDR